MIVDPKSIERFWSKVEKTETCWNWTAACRKGYGAFKYNNKVYDTHRFSYMLANGDIPAGTAICHQCDNPLCVNPDHLFPGSIADNNRDMHSKGRHKGGTHWDPNRQVRTLSPEGNNVKLNENTAELIRMMHNIGYSVQDLAEQFDVARRTVQDVISGKTW